MTRYDDRLFRLRIRDDGKGIDPRILKEGKRAGHWGLPGVRERAKRLNARRGRMYAELAPYVPIFAGRCCICLIAMAYR